MKAASFIQVIDLLKSPKEGAIEYSNRNQMLIRKMYPEKQSDVNAAACIALTCLTRALDDDERVKLVHAGLIQRLLKLYAMTSDDREDVRSAALDCLKMYNVRVDHRNPTYADESTKNDKYYKRFNKVESAPLSPHNVNLQRKR
jgi:hypothetical protein